MNFAGSDERVNDGKLPSESGRSEATKRFALTEVERLYAEFEHRRKPRYEVQSSVFDFRETDDESCSELALRPYERSNVRQKFLVRVSPEIHVGRLARGFLCSPGLATRAHPLPRIVEINSTPRVRFLGGSWRFALGSDSLALAKVHAPRRADTSTNRRRPLQGANTRITCAGASAPPASCELQKRDDVGVGALFDCVASFGVGRAVRHRAASRRSGCVAPFGVASRRSAA